MANISPLAAIEAFSGIRNGNMRPECHDDFQDIPDISAFNPMQKNLLLLLLIFYCFQGEVIEPNRTIFEVGIIIVI